MQIKLIIPGTLPGLNAYIAAERASRYNATTGENYGRTWLAYRRKPEQEEAHG